MDALKYFLECYFNQNIDYGELDFLIEEFKKIEMETYKTQVEVELENIILNENYEKAYNYINQHSEREMNFEETKVFIYFLYNKIKDIPTSIEGKDFCNIKIITRKYKKEQIKEVPEIEIKINSLLDKNEFINLENLLIKHKPKDYQDALLNIADTNKNISIYTIICMLLTRQKSSELHALAAELLTQCLSDLKGVYQAAMHHIKKAILLSPKNISLKEFLLFLYYHQEELISANEAKEIASEIIKINPDNEMAKWIIEMSKYIIDE